MINQVFRFIVSFVFVSCAFCLIPCMVPAPDALTVSWIANTGKGDWSAGSNWAGGLRPQSLDHVNITASGNYEVDLSEPAAIDSITIGGGGALAIEGGIMLLSPIQMRRLQVAAVVENSPSPPYTPPGLSAVRRMLSEAQAVYWQNSSNLIFELASLQGLNSSSNPNMMNGGSCGDLFHSRDGCMHIKRQPYFSQFLGMLGVYIQPQTVGQTIGESSGFSSYVLVLGTSGIAFAHEVGHYLHLYHTFNQAFTDDMTAYADANKPSTFDTAALKAAYDKLKTYAGQQLDKQLQPYTYIDGDMTPEYGQWAAPNSNQSVLDTPPDPSPVLFQQHWGYGNLFNNVDECITPAPVCVPSDATCTYSLNPDRGNIMSYFYNCSSFFPMHISGDQFKRVDQALTLGSRRGLVDGAYPEGPAAVMTSDSDVHLFARGDDWNIWHAYTTGSVYHWAQWSPWVKDMNSSSFRTASGPAAVVTADKHIHLFALGTDHYVWHNVWNGSTWSGWTEKIGTGTFTAAPAATITSDGAIHLFARGYDYNIWHTYLAAGSWAGWNQELPAFPSNREMMSGPSVVVSGSNIHVFVLGDDRRLWHSYWTGSGWSAWSNSDTADGTFTGPPSSLVTPDGKIHLFARGDDLNIWHSAYSGGWSPWSTHGNTGLVGTYFHSSPSAVANSLGEIGLYAIDDTRTIRTRGYINPFMDTWGWYPAEWVRITDGAGIPLSNTFIQP